VPINGEWNNPALRRCDSKAWYPSWKVAESAAQRVSIRIGELVIAYPCFDCNCFHVGHPDRSQIIVRGTASRTPEKAPAAIILPRACPYCGGDIPDERRRAASMSSTPTVYCSRRCQQSRSKKAQHERKAARTKRTPEFLERPDSPWVDEDNPPDDPA
jgi:hypothetical protein